MKDETTAALRALILSTPGIKETDRADAGLTTLSFVSEALPSRNVWVDTDLAGRIAVDLEDFDSDREWDNAVGRLKPASLEDAAKAIADWLTGGDGDDRMQH